MNFNTAMFAPGVLYLSWCILVIIALLALRKFPFQVILKEPLYQHLILSASLALFCLWTLGIGLKGQNFELHLLGVTVVLMLVGLPPALLAGAIALCVFNLSGQAPWDAFALNYLLGIVLPLLISFAVLEFIRRLKQKNLFAFMLGGGFLGAIIARVVTTIIVYLMFMLSGDAELQRLLDNYLPWMFLIAFPEGFINGLVISAISVYYPHWVRYLDEKRYIDQR